MKEKIIKDWKFFLILIIAIVFIILGAFYSFKVSDKLYIKSEKIEAKKYINEIKEGTKLEQKIIAKYNNLQRIDIQFEPLKNESNISGEVVIGINNSDGQIISKQTITRNNIRENTIYEFKFKNQKNSEGKEYTLWIQFEKVENEKKFFSVKTDEQGNLAIQELYKSNTRQLIFIIITFMFSIYAFAISIFIFYKNNLKPEKIFLYTVPIICLFYMFCIPTFKNHDELWHWYKSYEVSIGQLMTGIDGNILGTEMPESISKFSDNWININYGEVYKNLNLELEPEKKVNLYAETSAVYSFVQYIPQGIGIFIARLFTNKVLLLAYAGRLMNMIIAITCIYFAIKKIPFGKKIILLASYIPIAIEGFTSLSPDAMTISVAFLYIAYIFNLTFDKSIQVINKQHLIILTALSIILSLCKIVYIPLVLLLFIIPREKFKNKSKIKVTIIIIAIACLINLIWLRIASVYLLNFREGDSSIQVKSILTHPINYIQMCLYTLNLNEGFWISTMYGEVLGWSDCIRVHSFVPNALFIFTIVIMCIDNTIKERIKKYQKIIITIVIFAIIILIFTSLYVQWTTCGSDSIGGIQGRYFIPILPLIVILIGGNLKNKSQYKDENIIKLIGIVGIIVQIIVVTQCIISNL